MIVGPAPPDASMSRTCSSVSRERAAARFDGRSSLQLMTITRSKPAMSRSSSTARSAVFAVCTATASGPLPAARPGRRRRLADDERARARLGVARELSEDDRRAAVGAEQESRLRSGHAARPSLIADCRSARGRSARARARVVLGQRDDRVVCRDDRPAAGLSCDLAAGVHEAEQRAVAVAERRIEHGPPGERVVAAHVDLVVPRSRGSRDRPRPRPTGARSGR